MNMQTERRRAERRQADSNAVDDLSPEYLALLEVCGGEIRATDRATLAERRRAETPAALPEEDSKMETAVATPPVADRRRAGADPSA